MSILAKTGIAFLAGLLAGLSFFLMIRNHCAEKALPATLISRDTIIRIVSHEPLRLERLPAKIRYVRDTFVVTKPFTATGDTVFMHDTIHATYDFPQNFFSLRMSRAPDTLLSERLVLGQPVKSGEWWEKPLFFVAGIAAGVIIRSIK